MSASPDGVPPALLHNLKHNQVLHERVLILTVQVEDVPYADPGARLEVHDAGHGFYRVVLHYGFMEDVDVPRELASLDCIGGPFDLITASFFLGRQKLPASPDKPGMALWGERLFTGMSRWSAMGVDFFTITTNHGRTEERRVGKGGGS